MIFLQLFATGGKFATGVVSTSGALLCLDLRISLQIFEKFEMTLLLFSGA